MADLIQAEEQLNSLIEKQAQNRAQGRKEANSREAEMDKALRVRQQAERERNRAAWHRHFLQLADSHFELASSFIRRADALYENDARGKTDG